MKFNNRFKNGHFKSLYSYMQIYWDRVGGWARIGGDLLIVNNWIKKYSICYFIFVIFWFPNLWCEFFVLSLLIPLILFYFFVYILCKFYAFKMSVFELIFKFCTLHRLMIKFYISLKSHDFFKYRTFFLHFMCFKK